MQMLQHSFIKWKYQNSPNQIYICKPTLEFHFSVKIIFNSIINCHVAEDYFQNHKKNQVLIKRSLTNGNAKSDDCFLARLCRIVFVVERQNNLLNIRTLNPMITDNFILWCLEIVITANEYNKHFGWSAIYKITLKTWAWRWQIGKTLEMHVDRTGSSLNGNP